MHVKYMRKRDREMKITRMQKLLATILAVALSLTMLPAQVSPKLFHISTNLLSASTLLSSAAGAYIFIQRSSPKI